MDPPTYWVPGIEIYVFVLKRIHGSVLIVTPDLTYYVHLTLCINHESFVTEKNRSFSLLTVKSDNGTVGKTPSRIRTS